MNMVVWRAMMTQIHKVETLEDYQLHVYFDNGNHVFLNMKSRINTVRFSLLSDPDFFNDVTTDGHFIRWRNQVEISVSEIFQLAQK